ncbi:hypothetical protein CLV46_0169 [Diaminobutyricimonas aerilata]|uniref:Uncharacterized protein n=1 Tax=Diaminobutyricimonas aerilata TaxID=1162967 RepID=A0A2M9CFJ2_9MICO|nr:hypothetical protein [Diaminobutyricimonas aerilata]PJJ70647.1 hypothetical protein CLV46_0169 [Diaminobutyricimonas aerilata]
MIASTLLFMVGTADVLRALPRPVRWPAVVVAWLALGVAITLGLGLAWPLTLLTVIGATAWVALMPSDDRERPRRLWPALLLAAVVGAVVAVDGAAPRGPLATAWRESAVGPFADVAPGLALGALAVGVFLTRSANLIARAALGRALGDNAPTAASTNPGWRVRIGRAEVGAVETVPRDPRTRPTLRGGRMIGPLERVLIVVLALADASTIIAALLAAKGIVRFPEISEDRGTGSKAEEFLVGSLTSWALSAGAVLFVLAVQER